MKTLIAAALIAIAAAQAPAAANGGSGKAMVAMLIDCVTPECDAIVIELGSDVVGDPRWCQGLHGLRVAQIAVTNNAIYPQIIPYGMGCWTPTSDGKVMISFLSFGDRELKALSIKQERFVKTRKFTKWSDYRPIAATPKK